MAADQILSRPADAAGLSITPGLLWAFSAWTEVFPASDFPSADVTLLGMTCLYQRSSIGADNTREMLFSIGVGAAGSEVEKIQLPMSARTDSVAGHFLGPMPMVFLPEPYLIPAGTRVAMRMAVADTTTFTYSGIKVFVQEAAAAVTASLIYNPFPQRLLRSL